MRRQRLILIRRADPRLALARVRIPDKRADADGQLRAGAVVGRAERVDVVDIEIATHAARERRLGARRLRAGQLSDQEAVGGGVAGAVVGAEDAGWVSGCDV